MAPAPTLEQLWRRAAEANLRYYRTVGQLAGVYGRAAVAVVRAARSEPEHAAAAGGAAPDVAAPVLALEAEEGSSAVGMFLVENRTQAHVEAPVEITDLADGAGRHIRPPLGFEPEVVTLAPGEQTLVQVGIAITDAVRPGVDYRAEVRVPGLVGTRIPVVVRRLAAE